MRRFGGSGAAPAAPTNSGGEGHTEQKSGEQQGGGGGFGRGFRPSGGGFGNKKKLNVGRISATAFQSHAPAPPAGPADAEGTEATPAWPVNEAPAPETIVAPTPVSTLKRKSPTEAMPKPSSGPSATAPAATTFRTTASDRPMLMSNATAASTVPRPAAAQRLASPAFPTPAPVHIRERNAPQTVEDNPQARPTGDSSRSTPVPLPRPRSVGSSQTVPPGEAGDKRVEPAQGTRFSGETTRSAALLRKQIMPPPSEDALNMNISTLDDADTQSLEGGEATDNVMETSYEDDLEEMEIEMEMDEGQNTGDYMIVLEPPDEIEAEYEAKTAENVEQRKQLQDQIDKLRPALTEEIFKVHKLHFSVLQSDATLEIERAITELREIITEARNTYCSGVAIVP